MHTDVSTSRRMVRAAAIAIGALLSSAALPLAAQPAAPQPGAPQPGAPIAELDPEQLEELAFQVDQLTSLQWSTRERASKAIVALGPAAGPHLAKMLSEPRPAEQLWRLRNALVAVGQAHLDPEALTLVLREHLEPLTLQLFVQWEVESEPAPTVLAEEGVELFKQLCAIDKVQVAPMASLLKTDSREILRTNLAYLLGRIGDPAHAGALVHATRDTSALVRVQAAHALGAMKAEAHAGRLLEMLKDPERTVQIAAALSLVPMRSKAAVGPMIEALPLGGAAGFAVNWALERLTGHETGYNAYRPERRHAGTKQWREWFLANKDTFELAATDAPGAELAVNEDEVWFEARGGRLDPRMRVMRLALGKPGAAIKIDGKLREVRALLEKLKPGR